MSRSNLLWVYKTKAVWGDDLPNGWGTGPLLWRFLFERYVSSSERFCCMEEQAERVWQLIEDPRVPLHQRAGLLLTFDRAVILRKHITFLAAGFEKLGQETAASDPEGTRANHWPAIGRAFLQAASLPLDHRLIGIGLNCTSVADVWGSYPKPIRWDTAPILCTSALLFEEEQRQEAE